MSEYSPNRSLLSGAVSAAPHPTPHLPRECEPCPAPQRALEERGGSAALLQRVPGQAGQGDQPPIGPQPALLPLSLCLCQGPSPSSPLGPGPQHTWFAATLLTPSSASWCLGHWPGSSPRKKPLWTPLSIPQTQILGRPQNVCRVLRNEHMRVKTPELMI